MSDSEIRVLITGAGGAGSLGRELMKSFQLASQKYKIVATNSSPTSIGLFETSFGYVIPKASSPQYLNTLLKICKKEKIQAVVGGSEPEIKIIAKNMKVFSENGIEVLSNTIDIIELCSDKYKLANFLSAKKNLSPKTVLFKNKSDFEKFESFPLVVKPRSGSGSRNVFIANDIEEASFFCNYLKKYNVEPLIQEYTGDHENEFSVGVLYADDGKLTTSIAMKRILEGGLSTRQVSFSNNSKNKYVVSSGHSQGLIDEFKDITEAGIKIAKIINSNGPINIQCRKTENGLSIFEINPRFSGTITSRSLVGHNEPDIYCRYKLYGEIPEKVQHKVGYVMRDFTEKFISLKEIEEKSRL